MKARLWNRRTDYDMVVSWWEGQKCPDDYVVPNDRLPPSGWVVEDDGGNPLCIGWFYVFAHIKGGLVGSIVSNPEAPAKVASKALDFLFLRMATEADRLGLEVLVGVTTREGIVRKASRYGFTKTTGHSIEYQRERGSF